MEPMDNVQGIGIPFFSEAEWERARPVIDDINTLARSYGEFVAKVEGFEQLFSRNGTPHVRVYMTIDQIRSWPGLRGRKIDTKVCAEYAAHRAQQQDDGNRRRG